VSGSEQEVGVINHRGDIVLISFKEYYIDDNGNEVLLTESKEPVAVIIGSPALNPAVGTALMTMKEGETRVVSIDGSMIFGVRDPMNVVTVPLKPLQDMGINPQVGQTITMGMRAGRVIKVTEDSVTVDFNHPLAGKTIYSKVTLIRRLKKDAEGVRAVIKGAFGQFADVVMVKVRKGLIDINMTPDVLMMVNLPMTLTVLGVSLSIAFPTKVVQYHITPKVIQTGGGDTRPIAKVQ